VFPKQRQTKHNARSQQGNKKIEKNKVIVPSYLHAEKMELTLGSGDNVTACRITHIIFRAPLGIKNAHGKKLLGMREEGKETISQFPPHSPWGGAKIDVSRP